MQLALHADHVCRVHVGTRKATLDESRCAQRFDEIRAPTMWCVHVRTFGAVGLQWRRVARGLEDGAQQRRHKFNIYIPALLMPAC